MSEKIKEVNEKPLYNVWQNFIYVIKNAWVRDKWVLFVIIFQILLTVSVSVVSMYLPKTVVLQITSGVAVETLIFTILAYTVGIMLLQAFKTYFYATEQAPRTILRLGICRDKLNKMMTTDYANLGEKKFTDANQKVQEATNNNNSTTEAIYGCFSNLGINLLGFAVYTALLVSVNPVILLITAATTIGGVFVRNWANKWEHDHVPESAEFGKRLWGIIEMGNDVSRAKDIRLFNMTGWLKDIYNANLKLAFDFSRRVQSKQLIADVVDCITTFLREGLAYAYLIWQVLFAGLPLDSFVLLFAAIGGFSGWIMGILGEYAVLSRHSLAYCNIRRFLEYPDKFKREDGEAIAAEQSKKYSLELRNVSFRYSGAENNILENINLTITPGENLAIIGLNGAGKTTLVKLLCGFFDPTEGQVLLNGNDIRKYNRNQYYSLFTAVFQDFNILPTTIAENISQLPLEQIDSKKLETALTLSDIHEKVTSLPEGVNSLLVKVVNDDAVELSGGETQKLMLARALYNSKPILILDEPTAALDSIAESRLYNKYNELSQGKTSLYISHRLASTRFCDRIVLIDKKQIAEIGTHDELMKMGGKYADLFEIQSKYYKEEKEGEPA